jgi:hypothetical protein
MAVKTLTINDRLISAREKETLLDVFHQGSSIGEMVHDRDRIPEVRATVLTALERFKQILETQTREAQTFGNFPSLFMGLVTEAGLWEYRDRGNGIEKSKGTKVFALAGKICNTGLIEVKTNVSKLSRKLF